MKICSLVFFAALLIFTSAANGYAAENRLMNIDPTSEGVAPGVFAPGVTILLPDGRAGIIKDVLPNGQLQTDLGVILLPDGSLLEDPSLKAQIREKPEVSRSENVDKPEDQVKIAIPEIVAPERKVQTPETPPAPAAEPERQLTLAELLPLTNSKSQPVQPALQPEKKTPPAAKPEKKISPKQPENKAATPKADKPPHKAEKPQKPKAGQELRIPEESIKNGNLDFLEGCWQGTRPEYFSKRTIKECFCFGANGKGGKRRVFDPLGGRKCIGACSATLSAHGVLSVTSQGAACDDGERWGQAEMTCRNSGPKTPCTWIFRDANNGRQSYSIPFVRVDSCGR